jgi:multiple sugar transport system substrate-binding protein
MATIAVVMQRCLTRWRTNGPAQPGSAATSGRGDARTSTSSNEECIVLDPARLIVSAASPRRRLLATVTLLALIVAACGGGTGSSAAPSVAAPSASAGSSVATTPEPSASAAGVSGAVEFFGWDVADLTTGLGKGFEAARVAFQDQNPGTEVTFEAVPFGDFVSAATTRARAGELGDVVEMLPGLNHEPVFAALTPTTKADWGDLGTTLTGWAGGVLDTADPETFAGVPIGGQGVIWYYNKALFTQAGLDPEKPPTTWAEFTAAADALKAADITPVAASGTDSFLAWWAWSSFSPQFFPNPEDVLAVRSGDIPLTDPRVLQSLQPVAEMFQKGYWNDDYADKAFTDMESAFINGDVAMIPGIITSIVNWAVWDDKMGPDAYGVFGAPKRDDAVGDGQFFNPTLIYGVNAESQNPDAAKAFIAYLASKEGQEILLKESGQFPNRGDIDLQAVVGSPGATAIQGVIDSRGASDVIQNQFSAAAQGEAFQKLTQAIVSGDLEGFLADLQAQQ